MKQASWMAAKQVFSIESEAVLEALGAIEKTEFARAVEVLVKAERIVCSGCGHSGIACAHFSHLLSCIERPACFMSPSDAVHGGAGFLQKDDVLVVASRGGKTQELLPIEQIAKKKGAKIIAITGDKLSPLAIAADIVLTMKVTRECDKYNCQGTTSFVVLSAIFDALQTALIEETDYNNEKFALVHPAGAVGIRLSKKTKN
jgi:D-arabinose 5-phosphate isomerase GutQ